MPPTPRARLAVACLLGLTVTAYRYAYALAAPPDHARGAGDFAPLWAAARAWWAGVDPLTAVGPGLAFPWPAPVVYPAPAYVALGPFTPLPLPIAVAAFVGVGAALLAWVVTRRTWAGLLAFASYPVFLAIVSGQWSLTLTAVAVLAPLAGLVAVKPTLGLAIVAAAPSGRWLVWAAVGAAVLVAVAWLVQPGWPTAFLAARALPLPAGWGPAGTSLAALYPPTVTLAGGVLVLLAAARWRRPEARLLAVLACVPLTPTGYELVPVLALVPATRGEWATLAAGSWAAWGVVGATGPHADYVGWFRASGVAGVWCVLLPATVMVLRRPNVGAVPAWPWRRARDSSPAAVVREA